MTILNTLSDKESQIEFEKNSQKLDAWIVAGSDGSTRTILKRTPVSQANGEECLLYFIDAAIPEQSIKQESFSEFDSLVASLENDPDSARGLSEGRKWVANQFYDAATLASLRLRAGLSQKQFAQVCGIEQPHVSRYEAGKHEPSLSVAAKMASALGVDLDDFFKAWENTRLKLNAETAYD